MTTGFYYKDTHMYADGVPLSSIAQAAGTPCYVYSSSVLTDQYERLRGALGRVLPQERTPLICFACKANSHIAVLAHLRTLGCGLEIVSEGELHRALRAGFSPQHIVVTGVGKEDREIAAYLQANVLQINVESIPELERINQIAGEMGLTADVVFRLNPDVAGGGHHKISTGRKRDKFGISVDSLHKAYAMAKQMSHIRPLGISMHIGSQVFDVARFQEAFEKIPSLVADLRAKGHTVSRLDIGGGFPIIYRDEKLLDLDAYARWVRDIIAPLGTQIIMEPGRYLVGNAGVLLTKVVYVKETDDRRFLVLDAGMNDLIRPAMYDAYHTIECEKEPQEVSQTSFLYDIVGPVCETGDTFAIDRPLPEMKAGDFAIIRSAGAYGASMASNYNTRPLAAEVMTRDGEFRLIRKRQTFEDILALENIPDDWNKK